VLAEPATASVLLQLWRAELEEMETSRKV